MRVEHYCNHTFFQKHSTTLLCNNMILNIFPSILSNVLTYGIDDYQNGAEKRKNNNVHFRLFFRNGLEL